MILQTGKFKLHIHLNFPSDSVIEKMEHFTQRGIKSKIISDI